MEYFVATFVGFFIVCNVLAVFLARHHQQLEAQRPRRLDMGIDHQGFRGRGEDFDEAMRLFDVVNRHMRTNKKKLDVDWRREGF